MSGRASSMQVGVQRAVMIFSGILLLMLILGIFLPDFRNELVIIGSESIRASDEDDAVTSSSDVKHSPDYTETQAVTLMLVYVTGAVRKPGVYEIAAGSILMDLADKAGGLQPDAAVDAVNLAMVLQPHQMVRIPFLEEVENASGPMPGVQRPDNMGRPGAGGTKVNINTAGVIELDSLPGIGESTARAIIRYRDSAGAFGCIEDIMNVPGIKEAKFDQIKELITVGW